MVSPLNHDVRLIGGAHSTLWFFDGQMPGMERSGSTRRSALTRAALAAGLAVVLGSASGGAVAGTPGMPANATSHSFITSDGTRLHYLEAGPASARTVVFVPGWCMPGWIFAPQINALQDRFHVLALDPRGQGDSDVPPFGYAWERRGRDVGELIAAAGGTDPVVLVGWSLGVLDSLAYVHQSGDAQIAGLVLIDNSIGEPPAPVARPGASASSPADRAPLTEEERRRRRAAFVASMFARDPGTDYRARPMDQALRMSQADERRLLAYDTPRETWRDAVHSVQAPVLYVIRPRWREQAAHLTAAKPNASVAVFEAAGHALFVDEPERFNALLIDFLDRQVAA